MVEVKLPAPVKATLAESHDQLRSIPGAIQYTTFYGEPDDAPPTGLLHSCPCGCGLLGSVAFRRLTPDAPGPLWSWDGNKETPTISPSIGFYGHNKISDGYHWHGFLQAGFFNQA